MTTSGISIHLEKLPIIVTQEECADDCGCCKIPFDSCRDVESSPIKKNVNNSALRSNGRLKDNKNVQTPSSKNSGKGEENSLLKKCSVVLHDIEGTSEVVDSSMCKRKEFTVYKRKDTKTPIKSKDSNAESSDNGSFHSISFGFASEENLTEKSKDKRKKLNLSSDPLFSDDSDDNQKEKEKDTCLTQIIKNLNNDEEEKLLKQSKRIEKISGSNAEQNYYTKEKNDSSKTINNGKREQALQKEKRTESSSSSSLEELTFVSSEDVNHDKGNDIQPKKSSKKTRDSSLRKIRKSLKSSVLSSSDESDIQEKVPRKQKRRGKRNNSISEKDSYKKGKNVSSKTNYDKNKEVLATKEEIIKKSSNEESSYLEEIKGKKITSDKVNTQIKKTFVLLHDIGSRLHSDSININDIDVALFADNCERIYNSADSSLNEKKFTDQKRKNKKTSIKVKSSAKVSGSDDFKIEEESVSQKRNSRDKSESGPSDDMYDKKEKHNLSSDYLFLDGSDDNQKHKEKEKRLARKTKVSPSVRNKKTWISSVLTSDDENTVEEKLPSKQKSNPDSLKDIYYCVKANRMQLKKCFVFLYDIGSLLSSNSININDIDWINFTNDLKDKSNNIKTSLSVKKKLTNNKRKEKTLESWDESHESSIETDSSSKESLIENGDKSKPKKSKSMKTMKSDSSDDFIEDAEKGKKRKKSQSKKDSKAKAKKQESDENRNKEKQLRKRQRVKYCESSDSEELSTLRKKKKLQSKSESHASSPDSDSTFKASLINNGSLDAENKKSKKAVKSKSKKKMESDSSEDFILSKKKNISVSSSEDEEWVNKRYIPVKKKVKRHRKKNVSREGEVDEKGKKDKQLRKRQEVKYYLSSDSDEEDALKKKKILPSRSENCESNISSESLGPKSEEQSKPEKSKSKEKMYFDSSDDSVFSKRKRNIKSSSSIFSNEEEEKEENKEKDMKKIKNKQSKRNSFMEQESSKGEKKEKQLRKRQQMNYCISSDSEEDSLEKVSGKVHSSKSHICNINSDTFKESLDSESEEESKLEKTKSKKKIKFDESNDSMFPKKKKRRKSSNCFTSDDDNDKEEDKEKAVKKTEIRQGKRNLSKEQESDECGKTEKQLGKKQQVKHYKSSDSEEDESLVKVKRIITF